MNFNYDPHKGKVISNNEIFIIFDFSCGRFYTHHSSYLKDYEDFLTSKGKKTIVWVNSSADQEVLDLFPKNVRAILRSNLYSYTIRDGTLKFFVDYLFNLLYKIGIPNFIVSILSYYYLRSALGELRSILNQHYKVNIVAPTLDGLGLRFISSALKRYGDKLNSISLRIMGVEQRSVFGVKNSLELISSLILKYPDKIRVGYEVKAFEKVLTFNEINKANCYWAPMPYINRSRSKSLNLSLGEMPLKLGFLGAARPNKGFDFIPKILDVLKTNCIDFTAYIHLPKFTWEEFTYVKEYLGKNHGDSIIFLESGITKDHLNSYISKMNLIVLPYRLENYKLAGSGILFIACDYSVPVSSFEKLAFTWDIETFNLGFSFKNEIDFLQKLQSLDLNKTYKAIKTYNQQRHKANCMFLGLI